MSRFEKVLAINGQTLEVDTSDEACEKFGFKHNEKIMDPYNRHGIIAGVAPIPETAGCVEKGEDVLWVSVEELDGKVCFFPNPANALLKI